MEFTVTQSYAELQEQVDALASLCRRLSDALRGAQREREILRAEIQRLMSNKVSS